MNMRTVSFTTLLSTCISFTLYSLSPSPGMIVLFNGTSSAGKSSIIRELQKVYGNAYTTVNGDDFMETYLTEHPAPQNLTPEEALVFDSRAACAIYTHARELSLQGKNVFVDTLWFDDEYEKYCAILGDKLVKVLVYCPFDTIVQHIEQRNQSGDPKEQRTLLQALSQSPAIYKLQEHPEEVIVDRISSSVLQALLLQAQKEETYRDLQIINPELADWALGYSNFLHQIYMQRYQFNTQQEIILVPQHQWDLIVNTGMHSLEEITEKIVEYLENI